MGNRNIAILMAAGKGSRLGGDVAKQFTNINGKMLLEYALHTFQQHLLIDEIVVVLPPDCPEAIKKQLKYNYPKIQAFAAGGSERFHSSWAAVQLFAGRTADNLLLHDAARPLIAAQTITDVINTLQNHEAAVVAIPATDTVLQVNETEQLTDVPARATLWYAQTPQAFRADLLCQAFERHFQHPEITPTDESGLVHHYCPDVDITIVRGTTENFKVTYPTDIERFKSIIQND